MSPGPRHTFVMRERPRTRRPQWAATATSVTVDIPTVSAGNVGPRAVKGGSQ